MKLRLTSSCFDRIIFIIIQSLARVQGIRCAAANDDVRELWKTGRERRG
ncbi:hypothetical protein S1OALGB6SA_2317 [Olavius algarvensis spirochete endosymbiont]|nr:hypothetical protein S1OALGB6SA_2317 [Olavius algarvensis spirochete endosymbiont]